MIRVAVLGAGRIGQIHAANVAANPLAKLVVVADPFPAAGKALAEKLNCDYSQSPDEVIARSDVDAVVIGPPRAGAEAQVACLAASKVPVIAAVHGVAFGGGLQVALTGAVLQPLTAAVLLPAPVSIFLMMAPVLALVPGNPKGRRPLFEAWPSTFLVSTPSTLNGGLAMTKSANLLS